MVQVYESWQISDVEKQFIQFKKQNQVSAINIQLILDALQTDVQSNWITCDGFVRVRSEYHGPQKLWKLNFANTALNQYFDKNPQRFKTRKEALQTGIDMAKLIAGKQVKAHPLSDYNETIATLPGTPLSFHKYRYSKGPKWTVRIQIEGDPTFGYSFESQHYKTLSDAAKGLLERYAANSAIYFEWLDQFKI